MASEHLTFSGSGQEAITRTIEVDADESAPHLSSPEEFQEFYEIDRTSEEIIRGDFKRIALQFPDELLNDSVPIYRMLKPMIGEGRELYVLADTSYGSCCVDEVAAQHVDADAMVHYGHACLSQTYRLPVIYVFGKKPIDVDDCVSSFVNVINRTELPPRDKQMSEQSTVVLRHDVAYTHVADKIVDGLRSALEPLHISILYSKVPSRLDPRPSTATSPPLSSTIPISADSNQPTEDSTIMYVGGESLGLTNLLMTHASSEVYSYDPRNKTTRLESTRTNRLLMRRYAVVQKARDADVFGILVGTLGVGSYLPLISHIRKLLSRSQKKSYTISVGKINPSKLGNFMEIECFILVACPENSLIDAKDFLRPIVTPYELEVALKAEQSWTGRYVLDFEKLLSEHASNVPSDPNQNSEEDPDQPMFSLITGKYRHAKRYGDEARAGGSEGPHSSALALRNQDSALSKLPDSAAGQFLAGRTYQGLEARLGGDKPSVLEQGRSGIARGYQDDRREDVQ